MGASIKTGGGNGGRRGRRRSRHAPMSEINVTPFVDVMLVLLIIFMVTAPLITPSVVDLPSVGRAAKQPDQVVQIVIGKEELLELKTGDTTTRVSLRDLAATVKKTQANQPNSAVVISADRSVKYEVVVRVMDTLQRAGVQRVGLSVQLVN